MRVRRLPVRPDLEQLHRQAKELLRAIHAGDADAIAELREHHPESIDSSAAKLADAQLVLARSYSASSWTRLVHAVQLAEAIWRDDSDEVLALITRNSDLIHDHVLIRTDSNWGPPMTYAANLGRDRLIRLLHGHGARDLESAAGRAALQGKPDTVRMIYDLAGRPSLEKWTLAGPAYTLSVEGTAVLLTLGARVAGPEGVDSNTMEHLLGTDSRNPSAKHRILEMYVEHGFEPPDTPVMALHRGRIDLLEAHLARDPDLLARTFDIADVFPLALRAPESRTRLRGRRCMERHSSTSPLTSTSWRSRSGCSTGAWIRTHGRRSMPTASAGTLRSSRRSSRSATSGSTTARVSRTKRASHASCSPGGPSRTSGRPSAPASRRDTGAGRFASIGT